MTGYDSFFNQIVTVWPQFGFIPVFECQLHSRPLMKPFRGMAISFLINTFTDLKGTQFYFYSLVHWLTYPTSIRYFSSLRTWMLYFERIPLSDNLEITTSVVAACGGP